MSEPKRYELYVDASLQAEEGGEWVKYDDYARLKAEVHRLNEIVGSDAIDRKYGMCCDASDEIARLKAEVNSLKEERRFLNGRLDHFVQQTVKNREQVERLTKAGDVLANNIVWVELYRPLVAKWNAAKEGKQP